ncbi:hypothetical protein [Vibrio sp. JPW-9-11-11]|uniref:hypothetical protein n=1 Tax=Vibrio sp. JPW-9-11-11 TaxID=1416532 RepID=UPI001593493D|nr:hypothetical protein [Vibrio sp. JPW-9-11-11]
MRQAKIAFMACLIGAMLSGCNGGSGSGSSTDSSSPDVDVKDNGLEVLAEARAADSVKRQFVVPATDTTTAIRTAYLTDGTNFSVLGDPATSTNPRAFSVYNDSWFWIADNINSMAAQLVSYNTATNTLSTSYPMTHGLLGDLQAYESGKQNSFVVDNNMIYIATEPTANPGNDVGVSILDTTSGDVYSWPYFSPKIIAQTDSHVYVESNLVSSNEGRELSAIPKTNDVNSVGASERIIIAPGPTSVSIQDYVSLGSKFYFVASNGTTTNLYVSEGSVATTKELVSDLPGNVHDLIIFNSEVYLFVQESVYQFKDGQLTTESTMSFYDPNVRSSTNVKAVKVRGNILYVSHSYRPVTGDDKTYLSRSIAGGSFVTQELNGRVENLEIVNGEAIVSMISDSDSFLIKADGKETIVLQDPAPNTGYDFFSDSLVEYDVVSENKLLFVAVDGTNGNSLEYWTTDGTREGTIKVPSAQAQSLAALYNP